jgi:hypothetical protein
MMAAAANHSSSKPQQQETADGNAYGSKAVQATYVKLHEFGHSRCD